ncbi:hypothetical protein Nekkels1_37 [Cellulophaga phage Nekkels_1]|uniref:Uncharacterized protein n=1 Tax=Cellulophaga phage Nekkels_1 TaxID=2745692 RepID=A0A8E4XXQ6_9CAUD|nr:hypothetical protein M1M31_gp37 [Cellulophaga phage Nekkels_1]QQO97038.1 hypothetical protein Nekkels1_37 [Cellulophaga phage Nekkels_1]QQO97131.1 hypothetical protein Nekkels2_37 [Cellulophaga phage Nekkels_2]
MKQYLVFFGSKYYPSGGMNDFLCDFDTIDECVEAIKSKIKEHFDPDYQEEEEYVKYQWSCNWSHIYDSVNREEVWSK